MFEKPILFSAQMVRAILEGRKTQTRRVIKPQPEADLDPSTVVAAWDAGFIDEKCQYGKTGDHLWVCENFWIDKKTGEILGYCADDEGKYSKNKTVEKMPSVYMSRSESRITLEITDIRVERLQDISEDDAQAEGLQGRIDGLELPSEQFKDLWVSINGEQSWDKNPFVWVIEFKVLEITALLKNLQVKK